MVEDLTSPLGIIAATGCALAVVALAVAVGATSRLRAVRRSQRVLLGEGDTQDLVGHAAELHAAFAALQAEVADGAAALEGRLATVEHRVEAAISRVGVVRYDAYDELAGRQSMTIALLDGTRSGVVVSSLHHRDQARLYAKQVHEGRGDLPLSPEEEEAVRLASG